MIYNFTGLNDDGASPAAGFAPGKDGVLYGTTSVGGGASTCAYKGVQGCGAVFELMPPEHWADPGPKPFYMASLVRMETEPQGL